MITKRWLIRRGTIVVFTFVFALILDFTLPRLVPGNPVLTMLTELEESGRTVTPEMIQGIYALYGYNPHEPLLVQFVNYMSQLLKGNLGISYTFYPQPVTYIISISLPWTIFLVGSATIISWVPATFIGMYAAGTRNSKFDSILTPLLTFISQIPTFWLAFLLLLFFASDLKVLPLSGAYSRYVRPGLSLPFILSVLRHAVLPITSMAVVSLGGYLIHMRNTMVGVMSEDFVLVAKAKGLPKRRIIRSYAGANAILPNVTMLAMSLGYVFTGNILVETTFSYPGIGYMMSTAVFNDDYPLIMGIFLIFTIVMLAANFLADVLYAVLDPRVILE
ncbi:MAG: ABC transporter permease [Thermoprotei archaeon]